MDVDELLNKLFNSLNELLKRSNLAVGVTNSSNELLETLKIMENCVTCKDILEKNCFRGFYKSANKIKNFLVELEKEEQKKEKIICELSKEIIETDNELNRKVLCEDYVEKKMKKLTDKCGSKEMAIFLYRYKLHSKYKYDCIQWVSFNEFKNIEYIGKGDFGEVYKATLFSYTGHMESKDVLLKSIYNSGDILKEVYILIFNINLLSLKQILRILLLLLTNFI